MSWWQGATREVRAVSGRFTPTRGYMCSSILTWSDGAEIKFVREADE
jgi:hypothetical protein